MTRAARFIALGRQRLKDHGIEPTDAALALWLAQLAVNLCDGCSPGYMRAGLPAQFAPRPIEADQARPTAIEGETP